jgi:streptomycin 6-kinase
MFDKYLDKWELTTGGDPIVTTSSRLLPVRRRDIAAMLKIAVAAEERNGARLMPWWEGRGAAQILAHDEDAILMERAGCGSCLANLARSGGDDEASRTICAVVAELHSPRHHTPPDHLIPLTRWFRELILAGDRHSGVLGLCARTASELLASPEDVVILHGDIHHGNILDFGARGWLAIDPKGLIGERGFDYANLFCNPDHAFAASPGRLARQLDVVAGAAGLERTRLLRWVLAYSGLSAVWEFNDGLVTEPDLSIARVAAAELSRC